MTSRGNLKDKVTARLLSSKRPRPAFSSSEQVETSRPKKQNIPVEMPPRSVETIPSPSPPRPTEPPTSAEYGPCSPPIFQSRTVSVPGFGSKLVKKITFPADRAKLSAYETEDLFDLTFQTHLEALQATQVIRDRNKELRGLLGESEAQANLYKSAMEEAQAKIIELEKMRAEMMKELEESREKLCREQNKLSAETARRVEVEHKMEENALKLGEEISGLRHDLNEALDGAMKLFIDGQEAVKRAMKTKYPEEDFAWLPELSPPQSPESLPPNTTVNAPEQEK